MLHAPQRSWRTYITNKKEEKARLDALVSPDVQVCGRGVNVLTNDAAGRNGTGGMDQADVAAGGGESKHAIY